MALRKGAVFSEDAFLNHLYGGIDEPEPNIINIFICKLRRKLVENGAEGLSVGSVWGKAIFFANRDYQVLAKAGLLSPLVC